MAPAEEATRHPRILVIDDEPETARITSQWFRDKSVEIVAADGGKAGVERAQEGGFDVVLLDLTMPGMDGLEVAKALRGSPATAAVPIILLTACRDLETKVEAFRVGADDYVVKPFEMAELDVRIAAQLSRRKTLSGLKIEVQNLAQSNLQLEQLLMVDEKSGLYNFREFRRRLKEEWLRAERYRVPLSLVFLDIDHFKNVNDTLGHPAGDRVLKEFATLVAGGARANDIAARYGGEEFAVILPHTDGAMAVRVAERICSAVRKFVFLEGEVPTRITVSAGVATVTEAREVTTVDGLVRAADGALYEAKALGRDRVVAAQSS